MEAVERAGENMTSETGRQGQIVSVRDVLARWAYTEIADGHCSGLYLRHAAIKALRMKRAAGISFHALSTPERTILVDELCRARGSFVTDHVHGLDGYFRSL